MNTNKHRIRQQLYVYRIWFSCGESLSLPKNLKHKHHKVCKNNELKSKITKNIMEKLELNEQTKKYFEQKKPLIVGNWSASCWGKRFKLNNNGIKLIAREDENLEKIIFDMENKTVLVIVKKPILPDKAPRMTNLKDYPDFFEELQKNIEDILTKKGSFDSVKPNENRTVFEIISTN